MNSQSAARDLAANSLREMIQPLAACRRPLLIGVRHHSAALSRIMCDLLDAFEPEALLVELPADLNAWIEYLADPDTIAPVAISAVDAEGHLAFYPLADFSPELVAIRWARGRGVPVTACDLSVSAKREATDQTLWPGANGEPSRASNGQKDHDMHGLLDALLHRTGARDTGQLWERLVESPAITADPEAVRQMGLVFGWAVRSNDPGIPPHDLVREAAMRQAIRDAPQHSAAVVGSFHAPALIQQVVADTAVSDAALLASISTAPDSVGVALVPYSFEQLDERSGYPAGIRDPVWHQRMVEAETARQMDDAAVELVVGICRQMRRRGHVAGTPDATEIIRMMRDLRILRNLPTAGRSELIEAMQSCLAQGELHGRARELGHAAEHVLVGRRSGRVCSTTPRCGLVLSLDALLSELKLPDRESATEEPRELRLEVMRSGRDRARAVVLRQMTVAGIPYATRIDSMSQGQRENLAERWRVSWQQGTSATIESVSRFGVTLPQVVEGMLQSRHRATSSETVDDDAIPPAAFLQRLETAAECGLHHLVRESLDRLDQSFLKTAGLSELVLAATILGRIQAGHIPALPSDPSQQYLPIVGVFHFPEWRSRLSALLRTSLERLDGFEGSDRSEDVAALCDLVQWFHGDLPSLLTEEQPGLENESDARAREASGSLFASGSERLISWCRRTLDSGGDRMRGAAAGVLAIFGRLTPEAFSALLGGWFDSAVDIEGRRRLRGRVAGATQVLMPRMQSDTEWLLGLEDRLHLSNDTEFLNRLPALRGAFHEFSPADRERLLEARLQPYQERGTVRWHDHHESESHDDPADRVAALREADLQGRCAILQVLPDYPMMSEERVREDQRHDGGSANALPANGAPGEPADSQPIHQPIHAERANVGPGPGEIPMADRWRMILGVPPRSNLPSCRAASCLDELYGQGRGEGARQGIANRRRPGAGGGGEAPEPTTAEWSDDLETLFGSDICQEVLGEAAAGGRSAAVDLLDPDAVTPSIELLRQVLSLAGGLPEARAEKLRRLSRRITEALAHQLAIRLRTALSGLSTTRWTRRHNRRLNLPRTIRDNLAHVYRRPDGRPAVIAKRLVFHSPARREMDWHLTFVVDVSASMTTSVIYSALCASIFASLPALSVRFLAFSTEVIDLSGHVVDPLTLLLEVQIGGGTHIGLGLRAARTGIKVPSRSIVVLVSDFEEGVSVSEMLAEVRALVTAGVKCVGLAALDDSGTARFHQGYAQLAASAGMPVAAVSPERLAQWVGDQIRNQAGQSGKLPGGTVVS